MHIKIQQSFKSLIAGKEVDLPDFSILTGKNGSGKSHFLEALSTSNNAVIIIDGKSISNLEVKYIRFNGLNPQINSECNRESLNQIIHECLSFLLEAQRQWKRSGNSSDKSQWLRMNKDHFGHRNIKTDSFVTAIENVSKKIRKDFDEITEDELRTYVDYSDLEEKDAFKGQFATIFKSYQIKYDENEYKKYENEKKGTAHKVLSDEDFLSMYGPKPWVFVNAILKNANLPYEVSNPERSNRDSLFHFCLRNIEKGIEIQPADLSTGERVLMSLALAIYNSAKDNIMNRVLLIDEPDAALHPEFSKFLLATLKNHIVGKAGIKVIITTHSPTTVSMADEECIYEMNREEKIPVKATKEHALSILTEGIPSLRVSIDKRRIVFVESQHDAENYEKIFELVNRLVHLTVQPSFHAPHNREGTCCTDVINLIENLSGTNGIYGVIDYDGSNKSSNKVLVVGENGDSRYTIENYIFDPIFVGLALLHRNLNNCNQNYTYVGFQNANHDEKQSLIDWVLNEMGYTGNRIPYKTILGETFLIDAEWFSGKGHDLEKQLFVKWPCLNKLIQDRKDKKGNALKSVFLDTVIREYPQYLSKDFVTLFELFV